jgi:hypothetical protein
MENVHLDLEEVANQTGTMRSSFGALEKTNRDTRMETFNFIVDRGKTLVLF